jgi:hypothetical protein
MDDFAAGFHKFVRPPSPGPLLDAPDRAQSYAHAAATSRLPQIQDGTDVWVTVWAPSSRGAAPALALPFPASPSSPAQPLAVPIAPGTRRSFGRRK